MKWLKDTTGRFPERPHYDPGELDIECERIVEDFLMHRYSNVEYPILTEDILLLLEKETESVDAYADFSETELWGETIFTSGRKPRVRISKVLSQDDRFKNPFRTTITHEFSHVHFHGFLFELKARQESVFGNKSVDHPSVCRRSHIQSFTNYDWMEWQAGYSSGALLMPKRAVQRVADDVKARWGFTTESVEAGTLQGQVFVAAVSEKFAASEDAARVRLVKLGHLVQEAAALRVG